MSTFRRRLMMAQKEKMPDYLKFTALEPGTFTFTYGSNADPTYRASSITPYMQYSINGGNWVKLDFEKGASITTPTINVGDVVYWAGYNSMLGKYTETKLCPFSSTGRFNMSGDIRSIIAVDTLGTNYLYGSFYGYAVHSIFKGIKVVDASGLILPPAYYSQTYSRLFENCTELIYPPKVIGPNRSSDSDGSGTGRNSDAMFIGCTSLIKGPRIFVTDNIVDDYELTQFFDGCTSLKRIELIATDVSARGALNVWVRNVPATSDGIFVKHIDANWDVRGNSGAPNNWTILYFDPSTEKYYLSDKTTECDENGNTI